MVDAKHINDQPDSRDTMTICSFTERDGPYLTCIHACIPIINSNNFASHLLCLVQKTQRCLKKHVGLELVLPVFYP